MSLWLYAFASGLEIPAPLQHNRHTIAVDLRVLLHDALEHGFARGIFLVGQDGVGQDRWNACTALVAITCFDAVHPILSIIGQLEMHLS